MSQQPDHELEVLEDDQTVPPRPEELIADAADSPTTADASGTEGTAADSRST